MALLYSRHSLLRSGRYLAPAPPDSARAINCRCSVRDVYYPGGFPFRCKRYTCLISKLSCQQAKTTDLSTHAEKYSDHVDLLSPTPDNTHRLDHARLPGALTGAITLVCAPGTQPCDDSARAPPLLTAVAVLGILEAHQNIHTHSFKQHLSARSLSGIDCTFRTARIAAARACFPVVTCR